MGDRARPVMMPPLAGAVAARVPFFYGWVIVAVGGLAGAVTMGLVQSFSIFLPPLQQDLGASRATLSLAFSANMLTFGASSILGGALVDRYGTRRLATAGGIVFGLGLLLAAQSRGAGQLILTLGALAGLGMGALQGPMQYLTARWFDRRKGLALGLLLAGAALGTMVISPLAGALIRWQGWRATFVVLGLLTIVSILATVPLLVESPGACGLGPDGLPAASGREGSQRALSPWTSRTAIRTRAFWTLLGTWFCCCTSHSGPLVHAAAHAMDVGVSAPWAAAMMGGFGASAFLGRIVLGMVADRIGGRRTLIGALAAQAVLMAAFGGIQGAWVLMAAAVAFGLAYGGVFSQYPVILREYFGATRVGAVYGTAMFVNAVAMASGPFVAGLIHDVTGTYQVPFWVSGAIGAAATFLAMGLARPAPPATADDLSPHRYRAERATT
jgi:MFS family permease